MDKSKSFDKIKNGLEFLLSSGTLAYMKSPLVTNEFIKGNVSDIIYPIAYYSLMRTLDDGCKKPSLTLAGTIAILAIGAEFAQYFGLLGGTYDSKDIPMYLLGAGLAYGIDKLSFNNKKVKSEEEFILDLFK
ncbi:MAG TPA: hypothetical protein VJB35_04730 [Candidatus Nanoarchaeia archaeon]|nr:hypothetical protein [Candidatus Nanoarchaeia archaeon]